MDEVQLRAAIMRTVHLFDVVGVALTPLEVWRYLYCPDGASPLSVMSVLKAIREDSELKRVLMVSDGLITYAHEVHVAVSVHERWLHSVRVRQKGAWYGARFRRRLFPFVKYVSVLPFVRMVGASNYHGIDKVRPTSDIDMFVVTQPGRLWAVNNFLKVMTTVFGLRATPERHAKRFCFCYSVSAKPEALAFASCAQQEDVIMPVFSQLIRPLVDGDSGPVNNVVRLFHKENQTWASQRFPNAGAVSSTYAHPLKHRYFSRVYRVRRGLERLIPERLASGTDRFIGNIHTKYRAHRGKSSREGTSVIMEDDIQKAHPEDKRPLVLQAYKDQCKRYRVFSEVSVKAYA